MSFTLHPALQQDCIEIGQLELCRVLLMNDKQFPWLILVPAREDITEIYQLSSTDQQQLMHESSYIAEQLVALFLADKINIAALGNKVPQLHIHHVVRYKRDKAWPAPIWGMFNTLSYAEKELDRMVLRLQKYLNLDNH